MAKRRDQIEDETGPTRRCAATRIARPVAELVRFALSPEGVVTPDLRRRLPGRGVWVTARRETVDLAAKKGAFSRGFREKAQAPADLGALVERLMRRDALAALSFANKAGLVTAGFAKVEAEVAAGRAAALIQAADGGADGARKLAAAARRAGAAPVAAARLFDSAELDMALGRENVIHAALARGGATENFLAQCERLRFYRADPESPDGGPEARSDLDGPAQAAGPETRSPTGGGEAASPKGAPAPVGAGRQAPVGAGRQAPVGAGRNMAAERSAAGLTKGVGQPAQTMRRTGAARGNENG